MGCLERKKMFQYIPTFLDPELCEMTPKCPLNYEFKQKKVTRKYQ